MRLSNRNPCLTGSVRRATRRAAASWGDTAQVAAAFHDGDVRVATELRNHEKLLGTTLDARRDLRIRYVDAAANVEEPADVTSLDEYRQSLA